MKNNDFYLKKSSYYYDLPKELIAQHPVTPRDHSRLLNVKKDGTLSEKHFYDISDMLTENDVLVINKSKVIPARLFAKDINTSSPLEILLLRQNTLDTWYCMVKPGKKAKTGKKFIIENGVMTCEIISVEEKGDRLIRFDFDKNRNFMEILDEIGNMPLPPYITEKLTDKSRYQTVYAQDSGSAAAPTAGLHFTNELLEKIKAKGIKIIPVILHVGIGTFRPVKDEDITKHPMHSEYYYIPDESAKLISEAKKQGKRIISVGTTSTRTLESAFDKNGNLIKKEGETDIFIYPGYKYKMVDALITNFHLPESTLIMLVCALLGYDNTMKAYKYAVENKFRFFSFGDAMFIE